MLSNDVDGGYTVFAHTIYTYPVVYIHAKNSCSCILKIDILSFL